MKETGKNWIDAAKTLSQNPDALVKCSKCETGILQIKDVPIKEWKKIDRYLICDTCGKWNVLTMNAPENE